MATNTTTLDSLAKELWDYHHVNHKLSKADCILVLGSHDPSTADYAIELYNQHWAPILLFAGGSKNPLLASGLGQAEASVFAARAISKGVPPDCILVEKESRNTGENFERSAELLKEKGLILQNFIVVQKPYMERRTLATGLKLWPDKNITVTSPPVSYDEYTSSDIPKEQVINFMTGDLQRIRVYGDIGFQVKQTIPAKVWKAYRKLVSLGYTKRLLSDPEITALKCFQLNGKFNHDDNCLLAGLPDVQWKTDDLSEDVHLAFAEQSKALSFAPELISRLRRDLLDPESQGYLIVSGLGSGSPVDFDAIIKRATAICSLAGRPIKVMDKLGLWLDVPVKMDVATFRFGGTGYIPLHIDVVNSTNPPDIVGFLCERPDPLGGGLSIVSNLKRAIEQMLPEEIEFLKMPQFFDGKLNNMSEVGQELNPFPIANSKGNWKPMIRFTAKMLHGLPDGVSKTLITKLESILIEMQEVHQIGFGDLILVNQSIVAHGRTPLGPNQELVSPNLRRLLHQVYLRL